MDIQAKFQLSSLNDPKIFTTSFTKIELKTSTIRNFLCTLGKGRIVHTSLLTRFKMARSKINVALFLAKMLVLGN